MDNKNINLKGIAVICYFAICFSSITNFDLPNCQANNGTVKQEYLEIVNEDSKFQIPDDKWVVEAIKDIAYYLRNYKFNEWDHRYYEDKPNENFLGFFATFPIPPLRSLHWEVKANCCKEFYKCISYLYSVVNTAPYSRTEDSVNINASVLNKTTIKRLDYECRGRHAYANKIGLPLDDPQEKFKWSTTASYYMCWYTMLGTPSLSMIGDRCDNFANCLDPIFINHNSDPRANDNLSFQCAMYSFCPDPCCPIKHIKSIDACFNNNKNPCLVENADEDYFQRMCKMDRKYNHNFKDIVNNRWNTSCHCRKGFEWVSKFGLCVDINECLLRIHDCDITSQNCLNLAGTFVCICKWEYKLNVDAKVCVKRNTSILA